MPNPFSNRIKVRGWKRRIRQLERFRLAHRELDVEALRLDGRHYVKIWLDPWSRLVPRNPPHWFRRRIVAVFLDVLGAWRERLEAAGEPYYLELWLFHPDFHDTQVVAAMGDATAWYRTMFEPVADVAPHPPAEYRDADYDLAPLHWRVGRVIDAEMPMEFDAQRLTELATTADRIDESSTGEAIFVFYRGLVWLGSRPSALNPVAGDS